MLELSQGPPKEPLKLLLPFMRHPRLGEADQGQPVTAILPIYTHPWFTLPVRTFLCFENGTI